MTGLKTRPSFTAQVRRRLLLRLGVLSLFLAVGGGFLTFLLQSRQLESSTSGRIVERVMRFEVLVQTGENGIPDEATLVRKFVRFLERYPADPLGQVATALLHAADGRLLVSHPIAERPVQRRLEGMHRSGEVAHGARQMTERIAEQDYVLLSGPVRSASGDVLARIDCAFRLSDAALAANRGAALRAALWVALIFVVVTLSTYPITMQLTRRLIVLSGNLLQANIDTAQVLGSAIAKRDGDTAEHNSRVTLISVRIAEAHGLQDDEIRNLIKGAFVHDVGKIAISDSILLKPGRLTCEEFEVMKTHVREGVEIVERSDWLHEGVSVVRDHHEKFDGSGYLQGLKGEDIPVQARIFAIADVFDALTSRRPYKEPLSFEETMAVLEQGRGTHFDPEMLNAFIPIASGLYRELIQRPRRNPHLMLHQMVGHYFSRLTGDLKI